MSNDPGRSAIDADAEQRRLKSIILHINAGNQDNNASRQLSRVYLTPQPQQIRIVFVAGLIPGLSKAHIDTRL